MAANSSHCATIERQKRVKHKALHYIGVNYNRIFPTARSFEILQPSFTNCAGSGRSRGEAATLNNIGGVYNSIGQPQEALKYYNQALPMTREVGNRRGEAVILSNIGKMSTISDILKKHLNTITKLHQLGASWRLQGENTIRTNIGAAYNSISQPQEALKYDNQALPIWLQVGDRGGNLLL